MPVRRKVFRIEQMGPIGTPSAAFGDDMSARQQQEILAELKAMRELMERRPAAAAPDARESTALRELKDEVDAIQRALSRTEQEIAAVHVAAFAGPGTARVTRELDAIAESAERATQRILDAAENIDDAAKNLAAGLKHEQDQALALDIQDHVLRIFEACNFQDLAGQRIAKVLATLKFIEERIAHMKEIWGGLDAFKDYTRAAAAEREPRAALHGPRLIDDQGHISQDDIDIMFATG